MKKITFIAFAVLLTATCFSQNGMVTRAYNLLQAKELKKASVCIDSALTMEKYKNDAEAWYLKAYIHKSIFIENEKTNKESYARATAIECFKKSLELDTAKANRDKNKANLRYLISTVYNDLVLCIDTINYPVAVRNFEIIKKYYPLVDTSENHTAMNKYIVGFNNALATTVYSNLYIDNSKHDVKFYTMAKQLFEEVLKIEQNPHAIKSLGILEYDKKMLDGNLLFVYKYYEQSGSIDKTITLIRDEFKKELKSEYYISENDINNIGYKLMNSNKTKDALKIFTLNTELYPDGFNTYDSLGECLLKMKKKSEGVAAYKKSLELNPNNENAKKVLSELK